MEMVAEGVSTTKAVYELAKDMDIELPITEQVYQVLFEGKNSISAVGELMTRSKKAE